MYIGRDWYSAHYIYYTRLPRDYFMYKTNLSVLMVHRKIMRSNTSPGFPIFIAGHLFLQNYVHVPWRSIFSSTNMMILFLASFGFDWAFNMMSIEFPFYLSGTLRLPLIKVNNSEYNKKLSQYFFELYLYLLMERQRITVTPLQSKFSITSLYRDVSSISLCSYL